MPASSSPVQTVRDLLAALKAHKLQLQSCTIGVDGGLTFTSLPEMPAFLPPADKDEPKSFDELVQRTEADLPKDPKKREKWLQQRMRDALGEGIPADGLDT